MLALLFIRRPLEDFKHKPKPPRDEVFKDVVATPLGIFSGIRQSQLEFLRMPCVSETGKVGYVLMKRLYLEHMLNKLAINLHIEPENLLDGSREFIISADVDIEKGEECCPCYYATTKNADDRENLQRLESTVNTCLDHNLDALPANLLNDWKEKVLNLIFQHVKSVCTHLNT